VDDSTLVLLSDSTLGEVSTLEIFDTERGTVSNPTQTTFCFSPRHPTLEWDLFLEPCSHIPSPDELTVAPFHSDPSQRILCVATDDYFGLYAIHAELLLRLTREGEGQRIEWGKWNTHLIQVPVLQAHDRYVRISGCRLLFAGTDKDDCKTVNRYQRNIGPFYLRVYDFSKGGRANHLPPPDPAYAGIGKGKKWMSSSSRWLVPWDCREVADVSFGHDSVIFRIENAPGEDGAPDATGFEAQLHVWSF